MLRWFTGKGRSKSQHAARGRRLRFMRLEDREMLSATGLSLALSPTISDSPFQFTATYGKNETVVVMVAPDATGAVNESLAAEGKAVEQFVFAALTKQPPGNQGPGGGIVVLSATDTARELPEPGGTAGQPFHPGPATTEHASKNSTDLLSAREVSTIVQAAHKDLIADQPAQPPSAEQPTRYVAETIVVVREPDGEVVGIGVVFDSVAGNGADHGSTAGSAGGDRNIPAASLPAPRTTDPRNDRVAGSSVGFYGNADASGGRKDVSAASNARQEIRADANAHRDSASSESHNDTQTESKHDPLSYRANGASDAELADETAELSGSAKPEPANDALADPSSTSQRESAAARDRYFASRADESGDPEHWSLFDALPQNLASLENALQTLLAEREDLGRAVVDWLTDPGVWLWIDAAAVALIAAETSRRIARRQQREDSAPTHDSRQLLLSFPELFGLAPGAPS